MCDGARVWLPAAGAAAGAAHNCVAAAQAGAAATGRPTVGGWGCGCLHDKVRVAGRGYFWGAAVVVRLGGAQWVGWGTPLCQLPAESFQAFETVCVLLVAVLFP